MTSNDLMTLEETLAKLTGGDPTRIDWEMNEDPDGNLKAVFLTENKIRKCVFCRRQIGEDKIYPAMHIETKDRGFVYIFFCSRTCFGAPRIHAP